jgi:hypothetical protein
MMPVICRETDEVCKKEYIIAHPIVNVGFAIKSSLIEEIPAEETFADPCRRYGEGLNVYLMDGSKGAFGATGHFLVFSPGKFIFSITRRTAAKYFPNTLAVIDKAAERREEAEYGRA